MPFRPPVTGGGGRRVCHLGNVFLSLVVFVVTLLLSMVALDPDSTTRVLSARHSIVPLNYSESLPRSGVVPVTVQCAQHTVLVVPAIGAHGVGGVSSALDDFFSSSHLFSLAQLDSKATKGEKERGRERWPATNLTLSDVYGAVLLRDALESSPAATPHRNVLHLCSSDSCVFPYVAQQWTTRAASAAASLGSIANKSVGAAPVSHFAFVFGPREVAMATMQELEERNVRTLKFHDDFNTASVMPLVGEWDGPVLTELCVSLRDCRYFSEKKHRQLGLYLNVEGDKVPSESAHKHLREEWKRRDDVISKDSAEQRIPVLSFTTVSSQNTRWLYNGSFEFIHIDVGSDDSVAAVAFLYALCSATSPWGLGGVRNVLVSWYTSEWTTEVVTALLRLEKESRYTAVPLLRSCVDSDTAFNSSAPWSVGKVLLSLRKIAPWRGLYVSRMLTRSRAVQRPVCTALFSRQVSTLDELLETTARAMTSVPAAATSVERFFYHTIGISPRDEERLQVSTVEAATLSDGHGELHRLSRLLLHNIYFIIPAAVGSLLIRAVCKRRGLR